MDDPAEPDILLPVPARRSALRGSDGMPREQLDFLLLAVVIRIQHLRHAEARSLVNALLAMGVETVEVWMAKAVVENALDNHTEVLAALTRLDRLDPPQYRKGRKIEPRVRMRSFLKARATFALHGALDDEGRASLDFYLRQGEDVPPTAPAK